MKAKFSKTRRTKFRVQRDNTRVDFSSGNAERSKWYLVKISEMKCGLVRVSRLKRLRCLVAKGT
jgi:hypothetical protein